MIGAEQSVARHYTHGSLLSALLDELERAGVEVDRLTPSDLVPFEEFHIGGRDATAHLAGHMNLHPGMRLLDVGSGIGGTARYFALEHGCHVTGLDLTEEFCSVATDLSVRLGLDTQNDFVHGSALDLPFADGAFDGAYMLHVGMNIEDKARLVSETARVLRPGGQFAIYDILDGGGGAPHFPVPWAQDASTSFLVDIDSFCGTLEDEGFEVVTKEDRSEAGIAFFREQAATRATGTAPAVGVAILMGESGLERLANAARSLEEGRISPWIVIARKAE